MYMFEMGKKKRIKFYVTNTNPYNIYDITFIDPDINPIKVPNIMKPKEKKLFVLDILPLDRITSINFDCRYKRKMRR